MSISNLEGKFLGERLMEMIAWHCQTIEIAGSVRRGKAEVKDVEIVAIGRDTLLPHLDKLLMDGHIQQARYGEKMQTRWGSKYRGMCFPDQPNIKLELFLGDENNYGLIYWLRTGPGDANEYLAKQMTFNSPYLMDGGYLWKEAGTQRTPDSRKIRVNIEDDLFAYLDFPFIEPGERSEAVYRKHLSRPGHRYATGLVVLVPKFAMTAAPVNEQPSPQLQKSLF